MISRIAIRQSRRSTNLVIKDRIATVSLHNPPVNLLTRQTLASLSQNFEKLSLDPDIDGIVITSSKNGVFTGGLDIFELYQTTEEDLSSYWTMLQDMWLKVYLCPLPGKF